MNKITPSLKKNILILAVITIVVISITTIVLYLINPNNYKALIEKKFYQSTRRQLILTGPISISVFPEIQVRVKQLAITNPPQINKGNFIELSALDFSLELMPLLKGTFHFTHITLENAKIFLIKNKDLNNWNFSGPGNKQKTTANIVINKLSFKDMQVNYKDLEKNKNISTEKFNLYVNQKNGEINIGNDQLELKNSSLELALEKHIIDSHINLNIRPYQINNDVKINQLNLEDFINLDGFKLHIESISVAGHLATDSNMNMLTLSGQEIIKFNKSVLYGLDIKQFNSRTTKVINDISTFKKLITYTHTTETIKLLKQSIEKVEGERKKNLADKSQLGQFQGSLLAKNGSVSIKTCKLTGGDLEGLCSGGFTTNNKINILFQVRLLSQGQQNLINYIYFPYYIKGNIKDPSTGLDWPYIIKQTAKYYSKK